MHRLNCACSRTTPWLDCRSRADVGWQLTSPANSVVEALQFIAVCWWNVVCLRASSSCLSRECIQCLDWGICSSFELFCFFLYCRCWCFVVFLVTHVLCALLHIPLCFLCLVSMICHIFPLLCVFVTFSSPVFFFSVPFLSRHAFRSLPLFFFIFSLILLTLVTFYCGGGVFFA